MVPRGKGRGPAARQSLNLLAFFVLVLSGLAHAASMAAPWNGEPLWWLQLAAMLLLVRQLLWARSARQAALVAWLFATSWLCGTFWWLYISMHVYGGLNPVITVLAVFGLAAALALYYALAAYLFALWGPAIGNWAAIYFAALWMLAEMARGILFTGFGWGAAGYAHHELLGSLAKYVGAYGLAALAAYMAAQLALTFTPARLASEPASATGVGLGAGATRILGRFLPQRNRLKELTGVALIVVMALVADRQYSQPGQTMDVALLQGNIKQSEKFEPTQGIADALQWYRATSSAQIANGGANAPRLVVLPETAIPILPQQLPGDYWPALIDPFVKSKHALMAGLPLGSYNDGYTNSVVAIQTGAGLAVQQASYTYSKHHLVPFGEFIPPLFKWFTQLMNIPLGDFNRGAVAQPSFVWQGQRLAPNICYEDLFGEELGARFADPATAPTVFVNISNIGWFGNTVAIDQHRNISRMRALEFERPFVRATNTGDTVVIDYQGHVTHALPRHIRGVLNAQVQGRGGDANSDGITPYARWVARWWLWPLMLGALAIVALAGFRNRRAGSRLV